MFLCSFFLAWLDKEAWVLSPLLCRCPAYISLFLCGASLTNSKNTVGYFLFQTGWSLLSTWTIIVSKSHSAFTCWPPVLTCPPAPRIPCFWFHGFHHPLTGPLLINNYLYRVQGRVSSVVQECVLSMPKAHVLALGSQTPSKPAATQAPVFSVCVFQLLPHFTQVFQSGLERLL